MQGMEGYIIVGAVLFALGLTGFLCRRNLIIMFLSTEIMFQGVLVTVVVFSRVHEQMDGQAFGLFLLAIAAVEAGVALGLIVLLHRIRGTLDAESWSVMRG